MLEKPCVGSLVHPGLARRGVIAAGPAFDRVPSLRKPLGLAWNRGLRIMRFEFALAFAAAMIVAGAAEACPNYNARAAFGEIFLPGNFAPDPYVRNVTAGGGHYMPNCGLNWQGWVAAAPDFEFTYQGGFGFPLTIGINSNADTIILINDPNGDWFYSDDAGGGWGLGGAITFPNPVPGTYDIWIGAYNRGSGIPAQLIITER